MLVAVRTCSMICPGVRIGRRRGTIGASLIKKESNESLLKPVQRCLPSTSTGQTYYLSQVGWRIGKTVSPGV